MKLKTNNKGSATITVVITMLMVVALGAALLFGAYTSYKVALAERADAKAFYSAEAAMDDIRAGIQERVSEALSAAYTKTLTDFAKATSAADFDPQKEFSHSFLAALRAGGESAILSSNTAYNPAVLQSFILPPEESTGAATLSAGGGAVVASQGETYTSLTLKAVTLKWTENGYESDLVTDIVISIPGFSGRLGEFAIAAEGGIAQNGGHSSVKGSVYSGADISVSSGSLTLGAEGRKIFVADDLVLDGENSTVSLSGEYFGFGNDPAVSAKSSAILINGRKVTLDLSAVSRLSLAGYSFINVVPENAYIDANSAAATDKISNDLAMGQSMAFKANQLAYLAPAECLTNYASNPCELRRAEQDGGKYVYEGITQNPDVVLWDGRRLSDYGGSLQPVYKALAGDPTIKIGYLFIKFDNAGNANRYFADYFEHHKEWVTQYKDFYISSLSASAASVTAAGNTFAAAEGGLELIEAAGGADIMGHRFSDFVNTANVDKIGTPLEFTQGDVTVIIAKGDYTLTKNVKGLVICSGKLTLSPNVTVTAAALPETILSATSGNHTLSEFLKPGFDDSAPGVENAWASDKLVVYENWTKN